MKKRILSLVLALALCAGLLVVPAGAHDMGKVGENNLISGSAAIDANGSLWMWGYNGEGQLGIESGNSRDKQGNPYQTVPLKVMDNVVSVSRGNKHTAAIRTDGSLWAWGYNMYGQVGNGAVRSSAAPVKVMDNVAAVSCGEEHTAAIDKDGTLWAWGKVSYLGNNGTGNDTGEFGTEVQTVPVKVMDNMAAVCCGDYHTAAIDKNGALWMWGYITLGNGSTENSFVPVKVMDNVVAVSCGERHTAAIDKNGALWTWGWNLYGQLGNGATEQGNILVPTKVMDNVAAVCCWAYCTAAIQTDGSLWTWGANPGSGLMLGNGGVGNAKNRYDETVQTVPMKILDNVAAVSDGIALKTDGSLWTWGSNSYGGLGTGLPGSSAVPVQITLGDGAAMSQGVRLNLNGGTGGGTLWTSGDGKLQVPTNPTKEGYTFGGWYTDEALTIPWNFDSLVSGNIVLYAKWNVISSTATTTAQSTQTVTLDGKPVELQGYTLQAPNGGDVTYVKLRDVAALLDGTEAQFNVEWRNGAIYVAAGKAYTSRNGTELKAITVLDTGFRWNTAPVLFDGLTGAMEGIVITDVENGGHTFFKLRDLAATLGFNVGWSAEKGVYVETDKPYDPNS